MQKWMYIYNIWPCSALTLIRFLLWFDVPGFFIYDGSDRSRPGCVDSLRSAVVGLLVRRHGRWGEAPRWVVPSFRGRQVPSVYVALSMVGGLVVPFGGHGVDRLCTGRVRSLGTVTPLRFVTSLETRIRWYSSVHCKRICNFNFHRSGIYSEVQKSMIYFKIQVKKSNNLCKSCIKGNHV